MSNIFKHVLARKPKRSTFNLSHMNSLTMNFGKLVPFLCEEVVPGDTWKVDSNVFVRFAPMVFPVMHDIKVTTHYFYVPFRLVWDNFEKFITGENEANNENPPVFPRVRLRVDGDEDSSFFDPGSLADYLNYPTTDANTETEGLRVSALPFRAYQLIYNEYYRDENLQPEVEFSRGDGEDAAPGDDAYAALLTLRNRAWSKDYFTSALPWTQKGPQQMVPVDGEAVISNSQHPTFTRIAASDNAYATFYYGSTDMSSHRDLKVANMMKDNDPNSPTASPGVALSGGVFTQAIDSAATIDNSRNLDLSGVEAIVTGAGFTINDLRRSSAIQRWLERNARGGSRYIESLLSHFGVESDDLRLQRPEFLGGATTPVVINDVLQTSQTTTGEGGSPQAQYAGIGFCNTNVNGFKRTFKERGLIIGILSVMPKPAYTEGLPRSLRKFDKFDYYWPEFANLGEQEVYNYELALRGDNIMETFGYAPRFAEYKYVPSRCHGEFKTTLSKWNLARHFENQPALTSEFIMCDDESNDLNRIFAVEAATEHHLFVQIRNSIKARRPMPYLPDPSL